MENPSAIAGLVGVLVVLSEVIKYLITRVVPLRQALPKEDEEKRDATRLNVQLLTEQVAQLKISLHTMSGTVNKLWEVHDRRDQDGVPVWYVPRSWSETQEKIVENLRQISELTRRSLQLLERMEQRNGFTKPSP